MIEQAETPTQVQARRGRELYELMEKCSQVPEWDGIIRNGYVTHPEKICMSEYSDITEVQEQLVLQKRAGKWPKLLQAL